MSNLEILHTVHEQENAYIYNEILRNEFLYEYLVVEYFVTNTAIVTNSYFTNDLDHERSDQSIIFLVEELSQNSELKSIIDNGRVIPNISNIIPEVA